MNNNNLQNFIDGIFSLNTRRFGTVAELMIKELFDFKESPSKQYDLYDSCHNLRIEVKFSRAMRENVDTIREENVIKQCLESANLKNRSFSSDETLRIKFDSNIQQIKREQFDMLYYGLFYTNCIEIYKVSADKSEGIPGYSDYQHYGNKGEGQFHINNGSIGYHRQNYLIKILTYSQLFELFESKQEISFPHP